MHGQELRGSRAYNSGSGSGRRFDIGNIVGEPFALATISIGFIAWLLSFVAQVLADLDETITAFPKFAWWTIAYELLCVLAVTIVCAFDAVHKYHVAIVGLMAAGLVFTCSAANNFVYSEKATMEAAGAGHILLSIIHIIWIFYFGSVSDSVPHAYVDSFALHKDSKMSGHLSPGGYHVDRPHTSTSSSHPPQMYTSAQLNGFETSSPVSGQYRNSVANYPSSPHQANTPVPGSSVVPADPEVAAPTEYPHRAKAIYSYDANPEDVNEISFAKHDILEVSDVSGRWWQARKQNGETGIAPSNYLILL